MNQVSVLEKTKDFVIVKMPRRMARNLSLDKTLSEKEALKILRAGMAEYRKGKTKTLTSLSELRNGN